MKIYTVKYDANRPSSKQVNIPNYSNSKIGIEVISNNEKIKLTKDNVKLTSGDTTLYANGEYSGYVTFPITTGDCGDDKAYTLRCEKAPEKYEETLSVQFRPMVAANLDFPFDKEIQSKVNGLEFNLFDFKWTVSINGQVDSKTGGIDYIMYKDAQSDKSWKYLFSKNKINGIFHWKNNITGKISDTVVYPDDFAGKEIIILRTAPETSLGPREDRIGDVTLTNANIGKPFKQNFNLLVNSIKSSICEEEKELKTVISETTYYKTENVDYNTANVIDDSIDKIPNNKAVKDYVDNKISVASGNTPKVFQAFKGSETYLKNNSVDVTGVKVGDIILAGSAENAIKIMWCGPEFDQNTIYIDNIDTNNMNKGVYSGVVMSISDTPYNTQIVVACGEKCVTFSGNKGE